MRRKRILPGVPRGRDHWTQQRCAHAHGLTHPNYVRPALKNDGTAKAEDPNLQNAPDMGALILIDPVTVSRRFRCVRPASSTPSRSRRNASGKRWLWPQLDKDHRAEADTRTLGPLTFGGDNGVKRIAHMGPIQSVNKNSLWPRQSPQKGDDAVCYGDSGSPLFLERDGVVEQIVSGVLSGWALWCQGSKDPYFRVDQETAHAFLQCVIDRQDDVARACRECSAENALGLCD